MATIQRLRDKIRKLQQLDELLADSDVRAEVISMFRNGELGDVKLPKKKAKSRKVAKARKGGKRLSGSYGQLGSLILHALDEQGKPLTTNFMETYARRHGYIFNSKPGPLINESLKTLKKNGYVRQAGSEGMRRLWELGSIDLASMEALRPHDGMTQ